MINLLGVSYHNIGPFKDKILTVFFDQGKFLVKAPIGTGKSFLFFDGPIYGLYKYASRTMLNIQSKEGWIKLLWEVDGQMYFVKRMLSKSKSKESCNSTLYTVNPADCFVPRNDGGAGEGRGTSNGIIDKDIEEFLKDVKMEEVGFKNETDLQQTLQNILPPREVFLNTVFLMQDSDNIFELQPADRLTVLKNVFNLLGIDEAKDKIAEKKKDIWYKLKATADTSKYDEKLKYLLAEYVETYKCIHVEEYKEFFQELGNVYEKVNMADFGVADFPVKLHEELDAEVEKGKSGYQKFQLQLSTLQQNIQEEEGKIRNFKETRGIASQQMQILTSKIAEVDPKKIEALKKQKKEFVDKQNAREAQVKHVETKKFPDFTSAGEAIPHAYNFVQYLKNTGKILAEEFKNLQLQHKHREEMLKDYEQQLADIDKKIALSENDIQQEATFHCTKTNASCPFVKEINKKVFGQLEKQKELLAKEKKILEEKLEKLKNSPMESPKGKEEMIDQIKNLLQEIDRKNIEKIYEESQVLVKEEKEIDKKIQVLESDMAKLEEYKVQSTEHKIQIENIEKNIKEAESKKLKAENEIEKAEEEMEKMGYAKVLEKEKMAIKMKEIYRDLKSLVDEFKDVQMQVKQLQHEEEIINNLYVIFSKELLLLVLQDHLPILSDIINGYLAQVVEYQISFSLHKSSTDKLELLAQIFDSQGERDVKSLSGGQRVILKIVRMLAISTYIHSPILFLDETINNLDADTVAKVADMLEDFVKQRAMKLYAVTHNQQIQDMKFWDKVIEL